MPRVSKVQRLNEADKEWLDQELVKRGFSGYEELEALCQDRGIDISSSSLHRYGKSFQERLEAVKLVTDQARTVVDSAPDEEGAVNEALMRLIQEKLFNVVVEAELDPGDISKVTKAIADLGRASVSQKRLAAEVRKQALEEAAAKAETAGQAKGVSEDGIAAMRAAIMEGMQ